MPHKISVLCAVNLITFSFPVCVLMYTYMCGCAWMSVCRVALSSIHNFCTICKLPEEVITLAFFLLLKIWFKLSILSMVKRTWRHWFFSRQVLGLYYSRHFENWKQNEIKNSGFTNSQKRKIFHQNFGLCAVDENTMRRARNWSQFIMLGRQHWRTLEVVTPLELRPKPPNIK